MKPWRRRDTQNFLADQLSLVETVLEHKRRAIQYCKQKNIQNPETIIATIILSAAWVFDRLDTPLTVGLCPDILLLRDESDQESHGINPNFPVTINHVLSNMTHDELLEAVTEALI